MSRTYRHRHFKSKRAKKFIDGSATAHRAKVCEEMSYLIAHVIFNYPCKHPDKPVLEYKRSEFFGTDHYALDHVVECLEFTRGTSQWNGGRVFSMHELVRNIGIIYDVDNAGACELGTSRWGGRKPWRRFIQKSDRRHVNTILSYVQKTEDVDSADRINPRETRI